MFKVEEDGVTHINVYSKGATQLGRFLSNFTYVRGLQTPDGEFCSIEGYWYWLSVSPEEPRRDELRKAYGYQAKELGRDLRGEDWVQSDVFKGKIKTAIRNKIMMSPQCIEALINNTLPFVHYYVFGGRAKVPAEGKWLWTYIVQLSEELKVTSKEKQHVEYATT